MTQHERRVLNLIRTAFAGVVLGDGVGLREADGLDDYADAETLASYRAQDEKHDWSSIPVMDLGHSNLSFFDADGMRFHLPAYLVADLEGSLKSDVLFHLFYMANGATSRFDSLSTAQRDAVREFLLLRLSEPHREFERPMIEAALRDYWTTRPD